jgi:hypothetical protein
MHCLQTLLTDMCSVGRVCISKREPVGHIASSAHSRAFRIHSSSLRHYLGVFDGSSAFSHHTLDDFSFSCIRVRFLHHGSVRWCYMAWLAFYVYAFDTLDAMVSRKTWTALVDIMHTVFFHIVLDYILARLAFSRGRIWLRGLAILQ